MCSVNTKDQNNLLKQRDFIESFNTVSKKYRKTIRFKTSEICSIVANSPAPRFYVGVEQAFKQYNKYKKEGRIDMKRESSARMFEEIFKRYESLLSQYGGKAFQYSLMMQVLCSPAPCFYLEENTALKFYYRAMQNKRRRVRK